MAINRPRFCEVQSACSVRGDGERIGRGGSRPVVQLS